MRTPIHTNDANIKNMKIKKGDTVQIMVGEEAGKKGKVLKVYPEGNKILIEGLNLYKKHKKPRRQGEKGEIVSVPRPLSAANIALFCSNCGKGMRVNKKRICQKCKTAL